MVVEKNTLKTYHFEGTFAPLEGEEFFQGYLHIPFEVPIGISEIHLHLTYEPKKVWIIDNLITLGLFDPTGFRGNAHRHPPDSEVVVSHHRASPGFVVGAVIPGEWTALLAAHAVVIDHEPCHWSLDIELIIEDKYPGLDSQNKNLILPSIRNASLRVDKARWFRGELHAHTNHSDGAFSLADVISRALVRKLDFLVIADHNTNTAFSELEQLDTHGLLVIPAIELTTFQGHALALGVKEWIDWRIGYQGYTMNQAADNTHTQGGLFILAHPNDIGNPFCTGCHWEYPDFDLNKADGIEIWNGMWRSENEENLQMWQTLQKANNSLVATAGCDFHYDDNWGEGAPYTNVYADSLSISALLQGIRDRRVWISNGPNLELSATDAETRAIVGIGETLQVKSGSFQVDFSWSAVPSNGVLIVQYKNGTVHESPIAPSGSTQIQVISTGDDSFWIKIISHTGELLAMTNPITLKKV